MSQIYTSTFLTKREGYALWNPPPLENSEGIATKPVSVGDVGILTSKQGFENLFSTYLDAKDRSHTLGVPSGFKRAPEPEIVTQKSFRRPGEVRVVGDAETTAYPTSLREVSPSGKYLFEVTGRSGAGAALMLPSGATRFDAVEPEALYDRAVANAAPWVQYSEETSGFLENHAFLVTGVDKAASFGVAAWDAPAPTDPVHLAVWEEEMSIRAYNVVNRGGDFVFQLSPDLSDKSKRSSEEVYALCLRGVVVAGRVGRARWWRSEAPVLKRVRRFLSLLTFHQFVRPVRVSLKQVKERRPKGYKSPEHPSLVASEYIFDIRGGVDYTVIPDDVWLSAGPKIFDPENALIPKVLISHLKAKYDIVIEDRVASLKPKTLDV